MKKEWFTYCLRLLVLLVLTCNAGGAFAETISGDKTVGPGETFIVTSEVTITGNLTNNGGTIVVDGGILVVNGTVKNTSVLKSTTTTTETRYEPSSAETLPQKDDKKYDIETSINYYQGTIELSNGGQLNVNGNFENNGGNIMITSTDSERISRLSTRGTFINKTPSISGSKIIKTTTSTWSKKSGSYSWRNPSTNTETIPLNSSIILSNGYLLVDDDIELQDNSIVTFAGSGIGEDVKSTIRVRNISGTEGNITQSKMQLLLLLLVRKVQWL